MRVPSLFALLGAAGILLASVGLALLSRARHAANEQVPDQVPAVEPSALERADLREVTTAQPDDLFPTPALTATRASIATQSTAKVLRQGSDPAAGAEVTWTPVAPVLLQSTWDWDEIDQIWWMEATSRTHADSRGFASPETPLLQDNLGSVIWIDLEGYEPLLGVLEPAIASLEGRRYQLHESPGVHVRVVDASGQPAEQAVVEQHGVDLADAALAPHHAPLLFRRSRSTDAHGTCKATRFPGRQALVARHGDLVSRPIVVDARRDEVTLVLREGFTVSGTVTRPASEELQGEIVPRITIGVRRDNVVQELATAVSRRDGTWGPVTVPCLPPDAKPRYLAEVHGVAVIPEETPFPAPAPGDHVTLHLDAQAGALQWFLAYDREEGVPLTGTTVTVSWEESGTRRAVSATARPDGYAHVLGIRSGTVRAVITKPGYCAGIFPATRIPPPKPETLTVVMSPCAQVSGRVVRDGKPVPDFELTSWPSADVPYRTTRLYRDQPDGSFTVEASTQETLGIVASAPGSPGSLPVQLQVPESGLTGVEIELVEAIHGSGRVVGAADWEPLIALVQPHVLGGGKVLTPWGPPLPVGPDGSFEGTAFRQGANRLVISAPGFATRDVFAESDGFHVDFGIIELKPAAELLVEIAHAPDGRYVLEIHTPVPLGTSAFQRDERGLLVARIQKVPEGKHRLVLTFPDEQTTFRDVTIVPGANVARFRGGAGTLIATVRGGAPAECWLGVEMHDEQGEWEYYSKKFTADGTSRIVGLPPGPARIYLRDFALTHTSTTATIVAGQETHVELTISDADLLLRVVDADGDPVSGATLRLHGTEEIKERHGGLTNEKGEFLIPSLHRGTYVLHVTHPTLGLAPDLRIDFTADETVEREIVLDGRASLDLQILDEDLPLPGIHCRLLDHSGNELTAVVLTNVEGRATFPRLTPGNYRARVAEETIWPLEVDLDVQPGAGLRTLQVRRLGDLLLRMVNSDGVPVNGTTVDLVDEVTGGSVQAWLDQGRDSGPEEMKTDLQGEIALVGLPRGVYRWSTASSEGVLTVEAGEESLALLAIE